MIDGSSEASEGKDALRQFSVRAGLTPVDETEITPIKLSADLSAFSQLVSQVVGRPESGLFFHNNEIVFIDARSGRCVMTAQKFRTWLSRAVIVFEKRHPETDNPIPITIGVETAAAVLADIEFSNRLKPLTGVNHVRLPVLRQSGALELLPYGYDEETGIYTVESGVQYETGMDIVAAVGWLRRIFGWVPVRDERSFSVLVAGLLALYVRHLPGADSLRPGFVARGNKPGCGKSVIVKSWQYPVLGRAPAVKMKRGEQLDKEMEAFMIAGVPVIFLDNVYGELASATLDQMLTSEESSGRSMGSHGLFQARNVAHLFVSANNLEANEDAARRFLLLDLFEAEDITERKPSEEELLDDSKMKSPEWRARMLSICWAFVSHWFQAGMPKGTVQMQTFERYSWLLGGIVEAAGFGNPFARPEVEASLNPDQAEFRELMEAVCEEMGMEAERDFTLEDLARLARGRQLYEDLIGTSDDGRALTIKKDRLTGDVATIATDEGYLTASHRTAFSKRIVHKMGEHVVVGGKKLQFGDARKRRKRVFRVRVL